ncbi:hypothetical protein DSECCO2_616340 [anaerobic digester metagenome]
MDAPLVYTTHKHLSIASFILIYYFRKVLSQYTYCQKRENGDGTRRLREAQEKETKFALSMTTICFQEK